MRNMFFSAVLAISGMLPLAAQVDRVPPGTQITVRNDQPIDARSYNDGRIYPATVARDVVDPDGRVVIPHGAPAELIVRRASGDELILDMESITVGGRRYALSTTDQAISGGDRAGVGENQRTAKYVGGGAVIGSIIGAIAGGGRGAAIGAAAGAGSGAVAQTETRGRRVFVPAESLVTFQLDRPLHVDVRDSGYDRDGYHYHRYDDQYRDHDRDQYRDHDRDQYRDRP
jgi:hypothetical protein